AERIRNGASTPVTVEIDLGGNILTHEPACAFCLHREPLEGIAARMVISVVRQVPPAARDHPWMSRLCVMQAQAQIEAAQEIEHGPV
ncbi:MAG: hypothetical protein PVI15_06970, partial [Chromatiales bacterium]